jgi:lysophospholipase L1-like esterase
VKRILAAVAALTVGATLAVTGSTSASAAVPPKMAVVGDSFTAGWTGTTRSQADAWWQTTARDMGWTVGNVVANPGAGYWTWGDYGTIYQALAAHPIAPDTNVVLLQAGLNDSNKSAPNVVASVNDVINLTKSQAPNATIVVIGMFVPGQQGMAPDRLNIARRLGDWDAVHDTPYLIAAMCTFEVSSDGTHPTALGHRQIGDWVAWHLVNRLGIPAYR